MRTCLTWIVATAALALAGCASEHFDTVVRRAAAASPPTTPRCAAEAAVTRLNTTGFRVESCGEVTFYRCGYARKSMGREQCCWPVDGEDAATSLFAVDANDAKTCGHFE